ncbi:hypothetical protein BKA70DRAFT_1289833 [Coprinopsis sp. MPI-PUGE-AT-0042]|nr:hypothetical protein BKA70DRAFT_1289833 [Coprinopsis sp. MPI-PUGE-AT-0042]
MAAQAINLVISSCLWVQIPLAIVAAMVWTSTPPELTDEILSYGGLREVASVAALTKHDAVTAPDHFRRRVHRRLEDFHLSPTPFLALLGESGALGSGSFVLALASALEDDFTPNDLDIYVPDSSYDTLVEGLDALGYRLLDHNECAVPPYADANQTLTRVEVFGTDKGQTYLNIISVVGPDPRIAIFLFHSTIVMNWMDSHSITIAYPSLTFNRLSLTNEWRDPPLQKRVACWDKYRGRGISFLSNCCDDEFLADQCGAGFCCYRAERSTDDGGCLKFDFQNGAGSLLCDMLPPLRWHLARPGVPESGYVLTPSDSFGECPLSGDRHWLTGNVQCMALPPKS